MPSGSPERQDAHCAPRSYGDGVGLTDGGGVRRGFSVGEGVGVGVGAAVALGDGAGGGEGVGEGVGVGLALGDGAGLALADGDGLALGDGAGSADVIAGSGVAETTVLGRGVVVGPGSAVGVARSRVGAGVTTGAMVARATTAVRTGTTTCEAANTNAPPSSATDRMVTTRVPVVRIAPRMTWVRRSDSHEWLVPRRARSSSAARRIRSSRSAVGRGTGSEASNPRTRVLLPISAVQAAQPLTCVASRAASAGLRSSSRNASMSSRACAQSRAWPTCGFVTSHT